MEHLRSVMNSLAGPHDRLNVSRHRRVPTRVPPLSEAVKNSAIFWDQYVREAEVYDLEMVRGMTGDLDTLLIFAGLFSAVNTAFIVDAYQDLKPDPMEGTNALLRQIIQQLNNATFSESEMAGGSSQPSPRTVSVNQLFFASLSCSLLAAFGAVLGKQWLNEYQRAGRYRAPFARGIQRHQKFLGMEQYHFDFIIQTLPTLLQLSLSFFLVALILFLWDIDYRVAAVVIAFSAVGFLFYFTTTIISTWDSTSPFSTRLSSYLAYFFQFRLKRNTAEDDRSDANRLEESSSLRFTIIPTSERGFLEVASECVAWLKENATSFNSASAMVRTAIILPEGIRQEKHLVGEEIGPIFITSILANNALELGTSNGTLNSTLRVLLDVITDWKPERVSSISRTLITQLHATLRFIVSNDHSSSELVLKILGQFISGTSIHELPLLIDMEVLRAVLEIKSLDDTGIRVALVYLWVWVKRTDAGILMEWFDSDWFRRVPGKLLTDTQWLDTGKTINDPDEEMLRFRLLWNRYYYVRSDSIPDYPPYRRNLVSLSRYLRCWMQAHPDDHQNQADIILSEFLKVLEAAHRTWSFGNTYPVGLASIAKMFGEDGHIDGAIQWVMGQRDLEALEILSPCVWAYHWSTYNPPPTPATLPKAYFNSVITLLDSGSILGRLGTEICARVGVDISHFAMPNLFSALCWLVQGHKDFLEPGMVRILPVLDLIGSHIVKQPSHSSFISKDEINSSLEKVARLFGDDAASFLETLGVESASEDDSEESGSGEGEYIRGRGRATRAIPARSRGKRR